MEYMGVASGCGCKEMYILLIPTSLVSAFFCSSIPSLLFVHLKKSFFILVLVLFCNLCNNYFAQYKHTYGRLRASHGSRMKGCTWFIC